jgi:hypothetical protein
VEEDEGTVPLRRQWPGWLIGGIVLAVIVTGTLAVVLGG